MRFLVWEVRSKKGNMEGKVWWVISNQPYGREVACKIPMIRVFLSFVEIQCHDFFLRKKITRADVVYEWISSSEWYCLKRLAR
jgi:hypothetical protein